MSAVGSLSSLPRLSICSPVPIKALSMAGNAPCMDSTENVEQCLLCTQLDYYKTRLRRVFTASSWKL